MNVITTSIPDFALGALSVNDNSSCVDCGNCPADWVSLGLGVTICLQCAGKHRSIGAHITLVRSLSLDEFPPEQLCYLVEGGNRNFKDYIASIQCHSGDDIDYGDPRVLYYRSNYRVDLI